MFKPLIKKIVLSLLSFCIATFLLLTGVTFAFTTNNSSPDSYENDDTFSQSKVIVINASEPQNHNFHDEADEDWVRFFALEDVFYTIEVSDPAAQCDAVIQIYDTDGTTPLNVPPKDDGREGEEEFLDWKCPGDGIYYIKIYNYDPYIFGVDTEYELSLNIIVAPFLSSVVGDVTDKNIREPVPYAMIKATGSQFSGSALSNVQGQYELILELDTYSITATADGYNNYTGTISVNKAAAIFPYNIELTPANTTAPVTSSTSSSTTTTPVCPIEALYGQNSTEAALLRDFRDTVLQVTPCGQKIIDSYYRLSPELQNTLLNDNKTRNLIKVAVDNMLPSILRILEYIE